ncbi:hypothetical protein NPIL_588731, partial [Nephila pilipes]
MSTNHLSVGRAVWIGTPSCWMEMDSLQSVPTMYAENCLKRQDRLQSRNLLEQEPKAQ